MDKKLIAPLKDVLVALVGILVVASKLAIVPLVLLTLLLLIIQRLMASASEGLNILYTRYGLKVLKIFGMGA